MVDVKTFVENVQKIAYERPTYRLGGKGSDGTCDCIGLVIGAIERAGGSWGGTHGSNWAARNRMTEIVRGIEAADLQYGWLVYKAKAPGESGWDLPDRYKDDEDQMDYYHVGVVTGVEPLEITHCTLGGGADGIVTDNRQGKWVYAGPLTLVDYREESERVTAKVTAPGGSTVNLRKTPVPNGKLVDRVPVGDEVEVLSSQLTWSLVKWKEKTGYMMTQYLQLPGAGDEAGDVVTLRISRQAAEELRAALQAQ